MGPSLSLGRADAACVVAADTALADACATALGNRVPEAAAINAAGEVDRRHPRPTWRSGGGGGAPGRRGDLELVPLEVRKILLRSVKSIRWGDKAGRGLQPRAPITRSINPAA